MTTAPATPLVTDDSLASLIDAALPSAAELRHDIHAHPELMFEEVRTSEVIQRELTDAGVAHVGGLAKGTGVLAYLPATESAESAKTIGLRADMDALPIIEATGVDYASTIQGVMHACGHDAHTAMLITTARILSKLDSRPNNVTFVFQPAEEGGAGGDLMVKDGALDGSRLGQPVDMLFGQHGWPDLPLGQVSTRPGPMLASCDEFWITINGKGGHAAMPHLAHDPVVCAAHLVTALQQIVSRNVSPLHGAVVSVTDISTPNDATNIIPAYAKLTGTTRTLHNEDRELAEQRIREVVAGVCQAMGCTAEVTYERGYPVTANANEAVEYFRNVAGVAWGAHRIDEMEYPSMGAEDFSFYCQHVPACFYLIGLNEGQQDPPLLHQPTFDFNDKALRQGIETFCRLAVS